MYLGFSRLVTRLGRRHGVTAALVAAVSTLLLLASEAGAAAPSHVDCDRGDSLQAVFRPSGQGRNPSISAPWRGHPREWHVQRKCRNH